MASTTTLRISITLSSKEPFSAAKPTRTLTNYFLPRQHPPRSLGISFSSRRREKSTAPPVTSKKTNKKKPTPKTVGENENENENVDEDAFEALFLMLEEDLKNDELNGNDEISEEELAKLEQELAEALEDDELFGAFQSITNNEEDADEDDGVDGDVDGSEVDDEFEDEEEEEKPIKLKNWQMRRLAYALKTGRRKTSIKSLAAELCLDRAVVLKLLRDPPPNLVMLSASLPDKPAPTIVDPVEEVVETVQVDTVTTDAAKTEGSKVKVPVHVMQSNWSARKRLKKVQVETLEQVYRRSKRPTNAMISSIVHVTNLPKKKVVKWFEDKREEEGVPEHRVPYQRSEPEPEPSVFTS
ncbi:hypothetical protein ABFS82_05G140200 [Erythranthe guttata]|uniref:Homeobox domain-containing protein n=1 Tax=Erythranthe guttata TaxID=4155 RepID=A0A022QWS2_ERYGU|nr:PREDICTED: protein OVEREXPRESSOR OF CATIONIC PEROXIDASE 3 [Erythranthe guttata]EYU32336.1 hypothetical protein MIMGU_mgv1a009058mg [Erythranthe guttata]|eukprot:XP_012843426.1 PREDICTED: protein OVEREXPRESSOR OF CATIONIC PEROXIDASE 3 [Erythranthe guttata]